MDRARPAGELLKLIYLLNLAFDVSRLKHVLPAPSMSECDQFTCKPPVQSRPAVTII
jgi:hypothetical protein